jgi:hypothetical protein
MRKRNITPERLSKSGFKQWKTAQKLTDNGMLVASLAFYIKRLKPGVETPSAPLEDFYRMERPRKWRAYLMASRRWLGTLYPSRDTILLPDDWHWRLVYCGRNDWLLDPAERSKFKKLNDILEVDDAVKEFSVAHPEMLERCKIFLEQNHSATIQDRLGKKKASDEEARLKEEYETKPKAQFWVDQPEEELAQPAAFNMMDFVQGNIKTHLKQVEVMMPWDPRLSRAHR